MGVYIKGFEIEEDHVCLRCRLSTKTAFDKLPFCDVTMKDIEDWSKRPEWCPLVPVPAHGRLGDLDKQNVQIEALIERHLHGYTKSTWDFVCELRNILKRNPAIIPAEPGEEEHTMEEFMYRQEGNPDDSSM